MKRLLPQALAGLGAALVSLALLLADGGGAALDHSLAAQARLLAGGVEQNRLGELSFRGAAGAEVAFEIWRGDGSPVARSSSLAGALTRQGAALGEIAFYPLELPDGRSGRAAELVFVPATAPGSPAPSSPLTATVVVAEPRAATRGAILLGGGVAGLTLQLLALILATRARRLDALPFRQLARRLDGIDAGALGDSFDPADWPAEAAPAISALNELLIRLKKAFDRERGFSANLAHEIRTPLAELRTLAEVAFRWPEDDPEERARVFEEVYAIGLQMERIVDNLLAISRYETGHHALLTAKVSLAAAVESAWRGVAAEAEKRGVVLETDLPANLLVTTDREKLALILTNLLSNAVAHGEPGVVRCRGTLDGDQFVLSLANPAQGLAGDDLDRMFERKWRKDRGDRGRHSGLGLALVATLCRRLGLTIAARLPAPDQIEITLRGPISGQAGETVRRAPERSS